MPHGGGYLRAAGDFGEQEHTGLLDTDHRLLLASVDAGGFDESNGRRIYNALLDRTRALPGVAS